MLVQQTLWEMPAAEIAASLGITRAAVYVRLARAKERLRRQIETLKAAEAGAE